MASSLFLILNTMFSSTFFEIYLMWWLFERVYWDPMNCEFMISSIYEYYLSLLWTLLCMIFIALYFFSGTLVWFCQLDWFFLQWEEVLCDGFDLAVLNLSDRRRSDTHVSLPLRIKRLGLFLHEYILSTSCHHSYCITPFSHELNTLDACWIVVDVWSNSSRCRIVSVY